MGLSERQELHDRPRNWSSHPEMGRGLPEVTRIASPVATSPSSRKRRRRSREGRAVVQGHTAI